MHLHCKIKKIMRLLKGGKVIAFLLAGILGGISVMGFFHLDQEAVSIYEMFSESLSSPAAAQVSINREINGESRSEGEDREEESKFYDLLFLIGSIVFMSSNTAILYIPVFLMLSLYIFKEVPGLDRGRRAGKIRFYRLRALKFLNPVQKIIRTRAERYDINPSFINFRGKLTRALVKDTPPGAGFSVIKYAYNQSIEY